MWSLDKGTFGPQKNSKVDNLYLPFPGQQNGKRSAVAETGVILNYKLSTAVNFPYGKLTAFYFPNPTVLGCFSFFDGPTVLQKMKVRKINRE